jgi:hypothetical protein
MNQIILVKFTQQPMIISLGCDERKIVILVIETSGGARNFVCYSFNEAY